jgi:hypothetical protein
MHALLSHLTCEEQKDEKGEQQEQSRASAAKACPGRDMGEKHESESTKQSTPRSRAGGEEKEESESLQPANQSDRAIIADNHNYTQPDSRLCRNFACAPSFRCMHVYVYSGPGK